MEKLVLIDGNSLFNRAFYATPVFTTQNGLPTNAVFGFVKLLFKILEDIKPEYLVVAFDMKAPTFRHKMYDGYKATRKPMPDDLAVQIAPLQRLLNAMGISICQKEGIEADDILGTLSKRFNVQSYIYTGDRDSYQLVDEKTDVCFTKRGVSDILHLNCDNFVGLTGLEPKQIIDLKALMGDKSDNIPGIPGIGEKTAMDLLARYGSLDNIYAHIDELKGSVKAKFTDNREIAYLSLKLATIDRECDIDINLQDCKAPIKFNGEVKGIFEELEFRSLLSLDIFDEEAGNAVNKITYPDRIIIRSYSEFKSILSEGDYFVVLSDEQAEIYKGGKQFSISAEYGLLNSDSISLDEFIEILKSIYLNSNNRVIAYDYKNQLYKLKNFGVEPKCAFEDLAVIKYLCEYNASETDFEKVCEHYGYNYEFCAFALSEIYKTLYKKLIDDGMGELYEKIEKPLIKVLYGMETEGVKVSLTVLEELSAHYRELIERYKQKVFEGCGKEFNINSPVQLGETLFNNLGISEVKKKKTQKYTTGAEVLEKLQDKYPIVGDILKFRLYQKLNSTYVEGFKPLIDKHSGLIHTTFHQTATTTGRLSSSNPNLQNIPIREEEGRELRKIFVPRKGNVFIDADYSQIELRLLAHFSECKELIEAYNSGTDIHAVTASQVFGVPLEKVTAKMRRDAKAVNFGIIYGISDFGLSKNLNIPVSTAKEYIEKYFATYSAVKDYMNKNVEFAKEHGYICTIAGRKRMIPEIKSPNYNIRQFGERAAMNMPLQGASADIIKIAMLNVDRALKQAGLKTKLILQVHDELLLEAPENEVSVAAQILKENMENAIQLKVPLTVDVHIGNSWYDAK